MQQACNFCTTRQFTVPFTVPLGVTVCCRELWLFFFWVSGFALVWFARQVGLVPMMTVEKAAGALSNAGACAPSHPVPRPTLPPGIAVQRTYDPTLIDGTGTI